MMNKQVEMIHTVERVKKKSNTQHSIVDGPTSVFPKLRRVQYVGSVVISKAVVGQRRLRMIYGPWFTHPIAISLSTVLERHVRTLM